MQLRAQLTQHLLDSQKVQYDSRAQPSKHNKPSTWNKMLCRTLSEAKGPAQRLDGRN